MAREIERKFLVVGTAWKSATRGVPLRQGYLSSHKERTVRVRLEGTRACLTIKGLTVGVERPEFEYVIPLADATEILDGLCERPLIEKLRYRVRVGKHDWEIDEFLGENEGLVVAEIELGSSDEPFERPTWLGPEVSSDPRYFNSNLARRPFRHWPASESTERR